LQNVVEFFGSGHGKGSHDGAGAMVKRFFRREQLNAQRKKLQNAKEVVTFLYEHLSNRPKSSTLVPSNLST
jgi:hypothetical protein